jgi:peptide deformylase|tara:strand:+ start:173 stop:775 length:603 start_codon:yes stop_codon:yes gene_type:complete
MSDVLSFDTAENKDDLSFWHAYKPFINADDGSMEIDLDHEFLWDDSLETFDFKNPQVDPVNLSASMVTLMRKLGGYGLAANQVGLPLKMFVMEGEPAYAIFNPKITYTGEEEILLEEGCLSYPGMNLKVTRPRFMRARFQDPYGDFVTRQYDGITARVFQHEFDHLLGVDFTQKVSKLRKQMAFKKWKKKYGRTTLSLPI